MRTKTIVLRSSAGDEQRIRAEKQSRMLAGAFPVRGLSFLLLPEGLSGVRNPSNMLRRQTRSALSKASAPVEPAAIALQTLYLYLLSAPLGRPALLRLSCQPISNQGGIT